MTNTPISPNPVTEKTEQGILNRSFDKRYDVLAFEPLFENAAGDALLTPSVNTPFPVDIANSVTLDITGSSVTIGGSVGDLDQFNLSTTNPLAVALVDTNGDQITGLSVVPTTSGGLSTYHLAAAGSTNATVVKASAGQLYGYFISNTSSSYRYLAFHNAASAPTAGAAIFFKIGIPPSAGANVEFTNGIAFSTGIAFTTVTGAADNDSNAVTANDLIVNLFYK